MLLNTVGASILIILFDFITRAVVAWSQYGEKTVFWMYLWGNCVDGIRWKFGYRGSVTLLTVSASHFHQIIVHYRTAPAILLPSNTFSWFSKLCPHDLDCAIRSICRSWDATWASFKWCKFHADRTIEKRVLNTMRHFNVIEPWFNTEMK